MITQGKQAHGSKLAAGAVSGLTRETRFPPLDQVGLLEPPRLLRSGQFPIKKRKITDLCVCLIFPLLAVSRALEWLSILTLPHLQSS